VTWNIGGGYVSDDGHKSYTYQDVDYFSSLLSTVCADIICLQEAHISIDVDQSRWIAEKLGMYVISYGYDTSHLQPKYKLAVAILSRYALSGPEFFMLPNPRMKLMCKGSEVVSHDKGFLVATATFSKKRYHIASGHLFPFHRFGLRLDNPRFIRIKEQIECLFIEKFASTLIGADMNTADLGAALPVLMHYYAGTHFGSTRPDGRVTDHILFPQTVQLVKAMTLKTLADHDLCVADLDVPTEH
jgi:hypothetical protein